MTTNPTEEYLRYAKVFQKQFRAVSTPELAALLAVLSDADFDRAKELFNDRQIRLDGELMWSFMTSCTALVVMTELENRRGVRPK